MCVVGIFKKRETGSSFYLLPTNLDWMLAREAYVPILLELA